MFQERRRFAPVREGDELDVKIEAVGEKGDGIAKKQGFVLFVPKTKAGDEVRIRVTKVLKNAGFAEVIGASTGPVREESKPAKKEEEDFQPSTENDSDSFGDEPEAEGVTETVETAETAEDEKPKEGTDEEEEV